MKITSRHLEICAANYFDYRRNLIVPNVSWGFGLGYEADLIIVTNNYYCWEVEIKTSIYDLWADLKKKKFQHSYLTKKIKRFYYLIPESLSKYKDEILTIIKPEAGLLIAGERKYSQGNLIIDVIRIAKPNKYVEKISDKEYLCLCRLAAMRIWNLKIHLNQYLNE